MKLSLGFSPCPNDTFIFDALVNKKIDTEGLEFEVRLEDVETLNRWAIEGKLDITKLSFPAFFQTSGSYRLLDAGSALGKGVGPLLVEKGVGSRESGVGSQESRVGSRESGVGSRQSGVEQQTIALPGMNTTAHLLFSFAYPEARLKKFMIFSAIEDSVLKEETELGVIIHENRFTYLEKGLHKIMDLGEYWEEKMKFPIPLGGIAIRESIERSTALKVNELIRKSLANAFSHYPLLPDYVKQHSQEMSEEVMRKHIDLYVNDYSISLGEDGKSAINALFGVFKTINNKISSKDSDLIFLYEGGPLKPGP